MVTVTLLLWCTHSLELELLVLRMLVLFLLSVASSIGATLLTIASYWDCASKSKVVWGIRTQRYEMPKIASLVQ